MRTRTVVTGVLAVALAAWTAEAAPQPHGTGSVAAPADLLELTPEQARAVGEEIRALRGTVRSLGEKIEGHSGATEWRTIAHERMQRHEIGVPGGETIRHSPEARPRRHDARPQPD